MTQISKAEALAQLSEGWCPICHTPFKTRTVEDERNQDQRCESGYRYRRVLREIQLLADGEMVKVETKYIIVPKEPDA